MESENSSRHFIDGRKIAEDIYTRIRTATQTNKQNPCLGIITCAPNFETKKYLALKEKKAAHVGIRTTCIELPADATTEDVLTALSKLTLETDGVVIQLPLPHAIDQKKVLEAIPETHDVDALNPKTTQVLSPVVGAIQEILGRENVSPFEKYVTIIGSGQLVGLPAYQWFVSQGAYVSVVTKDTENISHYTKNADIIVCGAGVPRLVTKDMVKEGVVILDAGTSEDGGVLCGDADPAVSEKASLFTPVPGGIGPITIAILLQNVLKLATQKGSVV